MLHIAQVLGHLWHKRENVVSYLPEAERPRVRRKLQKAYDCDTYEEAKAALESLKPELKLMNQSAVASLPTNGKLRRSHSGRVGTPLFYWYLAERPKDSSEPPVYQAGEAARALHPNLCNGVQGGTFP